MRALAGLFRVVVLFAASLFVSLPLLHFQPENDPGPSEPLLEGAENFVVIAAIGHPDQRPAPPMVIGL